MQMYNAIPDNSRAAIAESLDTAILRAAFLELEEEEMNGYRAEIRKEAGPQPDCAAFARKLRAGIARRRARAALTHTLPRIMRAVACLVGIIALGTGFALAASASAREWAAGVLTTGIENSKIDNMFAEDAPASYGGDDRPTAGYNSGVMLDGALWLLGGVNNENTIYRRETTEDAPAVLNPVNAGTRGLCALAGGDGELYCLHRDRESGRYGLSRILPGDGSYALEPLVDFTNEQLFFGDGRSGWSWNDRLIYFDGKLLFFYPYERAAEGPNGPAHIRIFAWDIEGEALSRTERVTGPYDWGCTLELFSGGESAAYLSFCDTKNSCVRIERFNSDLSLAPVAAVPCYAGSWASSFACNPATNALYYLCNGAVYVAPEFDAERAQRVAATTLDYGQGVCLGGNGYAVVNGEKATIFDLSDTGADLAELLVDAVGSESAEALFAEDHPNVVVASDDSWMDFDGGYRAMIAAGEANADVYMIQGDDLRCFMEADMCAPIQDPQLLEAAERLAPEVREFVCRDGALVAFPVRGCAYSDFGFDKARMAEAGIADADLPETWEEMLALLKDLSQRENVRDYCVMNMEGESTDNFGAFILHLMAAGYAQLCAAEERALNFEDEAFASLMKLWKEIDFDAFRCTPVRSTVETPGAGDVAVDASSLLTARMNYAPEGEREWLKRTVSLRFGADDPIVTRARGYFVMINAHSNRQALAQEYMRCFLRAERDPEAMLYLYAEPALEECEFEVPEGNFELYREKTGRLHFTDMSRYGTAPYHEYLKGLKDYAEGKCGDAELMQNLRRFHG